MTDSATHLRACFVDAGPALADLFGRLHRAGDSPLHVNRQPDVKPEELPAILDSASIAIVDHTHLPTAVAARCHGLRHVVFLGTGARSYMDPEALADLGIAVHTIKGYGDTAVAECAFSLMWAAARDLAAMDRALRAGRWQRTDGVQLHGKTLGLIGFGGIAQELARLAIGAGMHVVAWNRSPREHAGVEFVAIDALLAASHVVSLHLLLTDETRGFLSRERIAAMRDGAIVQLGSRCAARRGGARRRTVLGQTRARRPGRLHGRAAAGAAPAHQPAECHAVGPFGISHARSEHQSRRGRARALPAHRGRRRLRGNERSPRNRQAGQRRRRCCRARLASTSSFANAAAAGDRVLPAR
jgi:D-3-phosphoglycerate dehydrogenase